MSFVEPVYQRPQMSDLLDFTDEDMSAAIRRFFPDMYLDSPILITHRERLIAELWRDSPSDSELGRAVIKLKKFEPNWKQYQLVGPDAYPSLYHRDWPSTLNDELEQSANVANRIWSQVSDAIKKWTDEPLDSHPLTMQFVEAKYWYTRWSYFDSLAQAVEKQSALTGQDVFHIKLGDHTNMYTTRNVYLLQSQDIRLMITSDQLLMIKDVLFSRAQVLTAWEIVYHRDQELLNLVTGTFKWHELCLEIYHNAGFEILKQTEALAKAYLSHISDSVFRDDGPYPRMLAKVIDKEKKLMRQAHPELNPGQYLANKFDDLLKTSNNIQFITEVFGLLKVSGHPLIDPKDGGKSAAEVAREPDHTSQESVDRVNSEFKRVVLESYVKSGRGWPDLHFSEKAKKTRLYELYQRQFKHLGRGSYPLTDWVGVRFGKIAEFDYSPNYLDMIDDKSISFYREDLPAAWDMDFKPKTERRLLLELMRRENFDIREIVEKIRRREVPWGWLIVSLYPKEREFKIAARMFSMLVLEIRVFFALTEANLADSIFPFLPQQTMTKDRIQIQRSFLELTAPIQDPNVLRMYYEIDLSRWNLRFRKYLIHAIGGTVNDMFGEVGIYDFVHWFFENALINVRVPFCPPDDYKNPNPPESDLLWYNHKGGFEGIAQKLWTIATYCMIDLAVTDLPLSYTLYGQGDNQVVAIRMQRVDGEDPAVTLRKLRETLNKRVPQECERVNQEVKPEECLESTSVITYSKDVYVNGVYHPTTLKFMSRLFPHSSQIFPSVRTNIGSIFSTAMAGAEKSDNPMYAYYLATLHSAMYLYRMSAGRGIYGEQIQRARRRMKEHSFSSWVTFCLTLPSELGGFPILPFTAFIYKGGSDPLGKSVAACSMLAHANNLSSGRLFNRMLTQMYVDSIYQDKPSLGTLFADPFSIPIHKPVTSADGVADMTIEALRDSGSIELKEVKELMSADVLGYREQIEAICSRFRPVNPILIRDILDCSVSGVVSTISKMFVATRTLQSVVRIAGVPIVEKVLNLECESLIYMFNRFRDLPSDPAPIEPHYEATKRFRRRWMNDMDEDLAGVTTYLPFDFKISGTTEHFKSNGINAILINRHDPFATRGPYAPYVGSKTREKRSEHGYKIVGTDSTSQALRRLQLISSQTGEDPAFQTFVNAICLSRSNMILSDYSKELSRSDAGGNFCHRYAARVGHLGAYNIGSPNFASHCVLSTDNAEPLSGGVVDYPCMLQEMALAAQWALMHRFSHGNPSHCVTIVIPTDYPFEPLPNSSIQAPPGVEVPILRFPGNNLAFLGEVEIRRVTGLLHHTSVPLLESFNPSRSGRRQVLEAYFRSQLRKHDTSRALADGALAAHPIGTMDIAEVISNGLPLITDCMANVIADDALTNYMATEAKKRDRWRLDAFIQRVTPHLSNSVAPLIGHALLSNDPLVRTLRLYDSPAYTRMTARPTARLQGHVSRLARKKAQGFDRNYATRQTAVFTSENPHAASEAVFSRYCVILASWVSSHQVSTFTASHLLGAWLLPMYRGKHEEIDRLNCLHFIITAQHRWLISKGKPLLAQVFDDLRQGKMLVGYKMTVQDLMRSTRSVEVWGKIAYKLDPPPMLKIKPMTLIPRPECNQRHRRLLYGYRPLPSHQIDLEHRVRVWLYRNSGRMFPGSGTALSYWYPFGSLLAAKQLIIIGAGMGAAARVALDAGCPSVFGIDLRETVPLKSHRFRFYVPPLVADSQNCNRYEQLAETFTTTGDWFDPDVSRAILEYDNGTATLLLDLEASSKRFDLSLLDPVLRIKRYGMIVLRLFASNQEISMIGCDLKLSGCVYEIYDMDPTCISGSRVIVIRKWPQQMSVAESCCVCQWEHEGYLETTVVETVKGDEDFVPDCIAETSYNLIVPTEKHYTVQMAQQELQKMAESISGSYDSRFSYHQWTTLQAAMIAMYTVTIPQSALIPTLMKWMKYNEASVQEHGLSIRVRFDRRLLVHICKIASQLRSGDNPRLFLND